MKKKFVVILTVMATLTILIVGCTPAGGEPEAGAVDPTKPVAETGSELESSNSMMKSDLQGTRWVLESYMNAAGETVDALAGTEVTAEFSVDGRVAGNASCNNYFAGYSVDGDALSISQAGSTMMACQPEERMKQEADFMAALQSAATFVIDGDQLMIANGDGDVVLTFRASEPASLVGTSWTASTVNNNRQAVTGLIADTAITASFTEDGKLNGSAGCNNYMTSYTIDGNNITIQPPATTRKFCPEPEGIMDQEAAFVAMLPQAATYLISGDTLELRTADGALIVSFTAAQ